jgi:hypothetical protein
LLGDITLLEKDIVHSNLGYVRIGFENLFVQFILYDAHDLVELIKIYTVMPVMIRNTNQDRQYNNAVIVCNRSVAPDIMLYINRIALISKMR